MIFIFASLKNFKNYGDNFFNFKKLKNHGDTFLLDKEAEKTCNQFLHA